MHVIFCFLSRDVRICSRMGEFAQHGEFTIQSNVNGEWLTVCHSHRALSDLAGE